jgi:hypothetical protein
MFQSDARDIPSNPTPHLAFPRKWGRGTVEKEDRLGNGPTCTFGALDAAAARLNFVDDWGRTYMENKAAPSAWRQQKWD